MKSILLLGASGSIGEQTLDIMSAHPNEFSLIAFSVGHHIEKIPSILLNNQDVKGFCVENPADCESLKTMYPKLLILSGDEGLITLIRKFDVDLVINALVGFVGLAPTITALKRGTDVALANKESLVVGGELINNLLKQVQARLYPIDSEHVALSKCLQGHKPSEISRLILTASGGAFRDISREGLENVTIDDALHHPSWSMGKKITIDSATMMNKGFEVIEAHYLFHMPASKIAIVMHDESKVHSLVQFIDGSYLADIGPADMRIPIAYALYGEERTAQKVRGLAPEDFGAFHFHAFDIKRYPCVGFALKALKTKGSLPAVLNASNEVAVNAFLQGEIRFIEIESIIERALANHVLIKEPTLRQLVAVDSATRRFCLQLIKGKTK
ncbi:MAG: 1-deoxy-D-xylulose-5-phosphate reductoisomerase [Firmicutes bacterium]|nr:1-deoxy-D-xylulose-5-phosphate reductoisomerase [Bacillota bacterium]